MWQLHEKIAFCTMYVGIVYMYLKENLQQFCPFEKYFVKLCN